MVGCTALEISRLSEPGVYGDGDNLYLQVRGPKSKSWLLRYTVGGKARYLGLGSLRKLPLAKARVKARARSRNSARVSIRLRPSARRSNGGSSRRRGGSRSANALTNTSRRIRRHGATNSIANSGVRRLRGLSCRLSARCLSVRSIPPSCSKRSSRCGSGHPRRHRGCAAGSKSF